MISARTFGAVGDGTTDDYAALLAADAAGPFLLDAGTYKISSPVTLNSDILLESDAVLKPLGLVTINSALQAGDYKVFDTSLGGSVNLANSRSGVANSAWWGSLANGAGTIDATAINAAIASKAARAKVPGGRYNIAAPIDFTPWSTVSDTADIAHLFDAEDCKFIQTANLSEMVCLSPTDGGQLLRHTFKFGKLHGNKANHTSVCGVRLRCISNCRIDILDVLNFQGAGIYADQLDSPAFGTFNNLISIGDVADNGGSGLAIAALTTGSLGFEGNIVTMGRSGFNGGDGVGSGNSTNSRSIFNTFILGPLEHNAGYAVYERGGGNQWFVNNTNNNGNGVGGISSPAKKSAFYVYPEDGIAANIITHHRVVYKG